MERKFPFSEAHWIWKDGELVEFENATVHILSHSLHYGTAVFEGLRCYATPEGPAAFRLWEHMERLVKSSKILRMELAYSVQDLCDAVLETVRANRLGACYIRPLVIRGFGFIGVNPLKNPVETYIAAWPTRGKFLGPDAEEKGIEACVASWRRIHPASLPPLAKATGNYLNSALIAMEASLNGFTEAIGLDADGFVSEGSAENIFVVRDGVLMTPPVGAAILPGITRDTVLTIARDLEIPAREERIPRELLYTCDELFMAGTSVEITPVRSVDRIVVGEGRPGPVTRRIRERFEAVAKGEVEDPHGWLTPVGEPAS